MRPVLKVAIPFLAISGVLALLAVNLRAQAEFRIERPVIEVPQPVKNGEAEDAGPKRAVYDGDPVTPAPRCEELDEPFTAFCSEGDPCEMLLEIVHVEETTSGIVAVGGVHTTSDNASSIMLLSEDGGDTWFESAARTPRATFEKALFVDADHGWAAGTSGESGAGRQTFFLVTSDGGKRWRRFEVTAGGEERSGLIVDFLFDTPKHGYLILEKPELDDRFELYETFNGARSWSTRGLTPDRPRFPGRRRSIEIPNWRVEEDSGEAVYVIEGRDDKSSPWTTRARFAASLGTCP